MNEEKALLEQYVMTRQRVDELDADLKEAKKQLENCVTKLHESLQSRGALKTAVYDDIGSYAMGDPMLIASVNKDDEEKLFEFLKSEKREDIIKPTVHWKTLSSLVKEISDEGKLIPAFIKTYYKPTGRFYGNE